MTSHSLRRHARRHALRGLALLLTLAGVTAFQGANPAAACACGAFAPYDPAARVQMAQEAAIVTYSGTEETVDMRLTVDSVTQETGLIFPTPTQATVTAGDKALFSVILDQIAPIVTVEKDWWGLSGFALGGAHAADGSAAGSEAPAVLDVVRLGPFEATVLRASDADGLTAWLDANGYGLSDAVSALLGDYVERGWYFTALKLASDTAPLDGDLEPIRFTFEAATPVYPLLLSQAATADQHVVLYVFADHRMDAVFDRPAAAGQDDYYGRGRAGRTSWAGPVTEPDLQGLGAWLTVVEADFWEPSQTVLGDVTLVQAAADETNYTYITRTEIVRLGPLPAGWAIVLLVFLLTGPTAALSAIAVDRSRKRRAAGGVAT
ncbi:MAG: DUF2330 domain-containing protein [Propionibacteriaceae bacterium]|jgi:hypothetical protein|nr:DUF2330 domain-containing protein [Propionibacteriaceae bacterium]